MKNEISRRTALKGLGVVGIVASSNIVPAPRIIEDNYQSSNEEPVEFISFEPYSSLPYAPKIDRCIRRKKREGGYCLAGKDGSYEILIPKKELRDLLNERMWKEVSIRPMTEDEKQDFIKTSKNEIFGLWPHVQDRIRTTLEKLRKEIDNGTMYNEFGNRWEPTCYLAPLKRINLSMIDLENLSQDSLTREYASQNLDRMGLESFMQNTHEFGPGDWITRK